MLGKLADEEDLRSDYNRICKKYELLATNLHQALIGFLNEAGVDVLDVQSRIKEFDSFYEKIQRKGYRKPFEEVEDICGLRIICYYPSDLDKISKFIRSEFNVLESTDKADLLEPDRFGYRSFHFIVSIKREWSKAPNYRGLSDLKAEIQVRTILMHAWADVEHKLASNRKEQGPPQLRRKLSQLSALFEVADQHLDSLREDREKYKQVLLSSKKRRTVVFDPSQGLNIDNLQAVLDLHFHDRLVVTESTANLLDEMIEHGVTIEEIEDGYYKVKDILLQSEKERLKGTKVARMTQPGIVRHILDLTHDAYWSAREEALPEDVVQNIRKWRAALPPKTSPDIRHKPRD